MKVQSTQGRHAMKHIGTSLLTAFIVLTIWCVPARGDDAGFLWAYALHDSFSQDTFYAVDITKPFGLPDPIRPFGELTLQRDSRTTGGILPQTLNDNYGLLAAGVQLLSNSGLRVFVQVGTSFNFGPAIQALPTSSHLDARGGADYYRSWNDPPEGENRYYGAFFGNVLYYSRYQNALLYFEVTRGREFGSRKSPVQTYVRVSGSQDTKRLYYNDVVAFSTGAQILPLGRRGVTIGVEETFSAYTGAPPIPGDNTIARSYWSFRPQITYGASF
ncbi:MAG TPA: hypothetical protein VN860_07910 [Candidatus Acidoferrales bacterium]|nr:hypothetical protein [Candidatus Acidoferrales bacterium]